jgi:hypothetical protein
MFVNNIHSRVSSLKHKWASALVITYDLTTCMQNFTQLVGDDQDRVKNCQAGLLQHALGGQLCVGDRPYIGLMKPF